MESDPAPEPKPGSDDAPKLWVSGVLVPAEKIAEGCLAEPVELPEEAQCISLLGGESESAGKPSSHAAPNFFTRDVYSLLADHGLHVIPNEKGYVLSYHSESQQWHGRKPGANFAPKWGENRSELKCLLLVLLRLWDWFLDEYPEDPFATKHMAKLVEHEKTVLF
eukprot:Skav208331  [mRNA]  locus=scaffold1961:236136:236630:+ [translate_table: standard]